MQMSGYSNVAATAHRGGAAAGFFMWLDVCDDSIAVSVTPGKSFKSKWSTANCRSRGRVSYGSPTSPRCEQRNRRGTVKRKVDGATSAAMIAIEWIALRGSQ